jgi:ABC-type uncharacterized transport system ATPase subunit
MKLDRVWIEQFRIRGYRSCFSTSLKPSAGLSVLIGPNGSGKTNVLQGVLLLQRLLSRRYRRSPLEGRPSRSFLQATFRVNKVSIPFRAWVNYTTSDRNEDEVLSVREQWNFKAVTKVDRWDNVPSEVFYHPHFIVPRRVVGDSRVIAPIRVSSEDVYSFLPKRLRPLLIAISEYRSRISYYSASQFTNPSRCPSSFELDEDGDLRNPGVGRNEHLQFVFDLYTHSKNNASGYGEYLSIIGKEGIGLVDKITWKQVKVSSSTVEVKSGGKVVKERRDRLLIIPNVYLNRSHLSFNQLSEGTFKTLALLFYLVTDKSGLLLIEEPEVCVHHGLLASVIELIKTFSREKQILCSTHSDFVLDSLAPEQVLSVKNEGRLGTVVKMISESVSKQQFDALKDYLRTSGNLGEYWRHGGFDE